MRVSPLLLLRTNFRHNSTIYSFRVYITYYAMLKKLLFPNDNKKFVSILRCTLMAFLIIHHKLIFSGVKKWIISKL